MKLVKTEEAVGHVLCHDITQIIKDEKKGPVFRKGHIIEPADIPVLLSVGKEHLYVWENDETMLHEDEAAEILRDICIGDHMRATEPKEGKIELIAEEDGLLLIDIERLRAINALGDMMIATRASGFMVKRGDKLCGTRVIPLVIKKERMEKAKELAGDTPLMRLVPVRPAAQLWRRHDRQRGFPGPDQGHLYARDRAEARGIRLYDDRARDPGRRTREDHCRGAGHAG